MDVEMYKLTKCKAFYKLALSNLGRCVDRRKFKRDAQTGQRKYL